MIASLVVYSEFALAIASSAMVALYGHPTEYYPYNSL